MTTIWLFGQQIWGLTVFLQICQDLKPAELCELSSTHELITGRALLARLPLAFAFCVWVFVAFASILKRPADDTHGDLLLFVQLRTALASDGRE